MRLAPKSVRMRLTLWYAATLGLALILYAALILFFAERMMRADSMRQGERDLDLAEQMLEREKGQLVWEDVDDNPATSSPIPPVKIVARQDGQILFVSPQYEAMKKVRHGEVARYGQIEGLDVQIVAKVPTAFMDQQLGLLALALGLGIPAAIALASFGGYLLARRSLAPVDRMTEQARSISADDLTQRLDIKNSNDELGRLATVFNETFTRLEQSFSQLQRFTADASHELRTPLTAIRSVGEVGLREPRSPEQYREIIGSMLEECDRLARLVESLLMLSRADGGQVRLQREDIDLRALAGDVIQLLSVVAEEKNISVRFTCESDKPLIVQGNRVVLRQAVINILDNAIRYSPVGVSVEVSVAERNSHALIEVADHGPGIPVEDQSKVFDRFYRVDKARSRAMGGAGLGLSIARWAVEAHGGRIELESQAGQGALFRVCLPGLGSINHQQESRT